MSKDVDYEGSIVVQAEGIVLNLPDTGDRQSPACKQLQQLQRMF
jgi:hypothetical protein